MNFFLRLTMKIQNNRVLSRKLQYGVFLQFCIAMSLSIQLVPSVCSSCRNVRSCGAKHANSFSCLIKLSFLTSKTLQGYVIFFDLFFFWLIIGCFLHSCSFLFCALALMVLPFRVENFSKFSLEWFWLTAKALFY